MSQPPCLVLGTEVDQFLEYFYKERLEFYTDKHRELQGVRSYIKSKAQKVTSYHSDIDMNYKNHVFLVEFDRNRAKNINFNTIVGRDMLLRNNRKNYKMLFHIFDSLRIKNGKLIPDVHQLWTAAPVGCTVFQT